MRLIACILITLSLTFAQFAQAGQLYIFESEGPIVNNKTAYSAENWIAVLKKIQTLYKSDVVVYGGRGKSGKLMDVIPAQITYLNKAQEITKLYVGSLPGATWEEKKKNVNYADLTKEFEKTFPAYTLSYMITYGSYGLVNSL